jgi:hypothetical protein
VADSIVVAGGVSVEDGFGFADPNTFDRRLVKNPITDTSLCCSQSLAASRKTSLENGFHLAIAGENASRRDGAIVAWHEVPGAAPPKRAVP